MRGWTPRLEDPLLRIGATLMFLALACAGLVFAYASIGRPPERADAAVRTAVRSPAKPLVRTDPGIDPWVERDIPPPPPQPQAPVKPGAAAGSASPQAAAGSASPQAASVPKPAKRPNPTSGHRPERQEVTTQSSEKTPSQSSRQAHQVDQAPQYHLPPGVIMTLTIPSIGLENAPVLDSDTKSALDRGVVHLPDTSMPWSDTPERNVYLAGHRLGWPGTGSHLIFYRLNELTGGEKVTLRARDGTRYNYKVLESFAVRPDENWVTGRVRGRDLLTLQTCTPIPTFQKRLIVRAERI